MEPLILEIKTPGLHRYHVLDKSEISIGRALDNDIILSDPTVEPYHLRILRDNEGQVELQNLANVNPLKFDNPLQDKFTSAMLPIEFGLGRISARILSRNHRVEATKSLASGDGRMKHLYGHWGWAASLLMLCFLTSGFEFYFSSYNTLKWDELLNFVFRESVLSIAADSGAALASGTCVRLPFDEWFSDRDLTPLVESFDRGWKVEVSGTMPASEVLTGLEELAGLRDEALRLSGGDSPPRIASAVEFILEGLHLSNRLNKKTRDRRSRYARA